MMGISFRLLLVLFIAFILTILPVPGVLRYFYPPWVLLVILYVQFFLPNYFNVVLLVFLGLCLDVLLSSVMGEHVFALTIITGIASSKARRMKFFSLAQQMMLIASLCIIYQIILFCIDTILGYKSDLGVLLGSSLMGTVLWPWVRLMADKKLLSYK